MQLPAHTRSSQSGSRGRASADRGDDTRRGARANGGDRTRPQRRAASDRQNQGTPRPRPRRGDPSAALLAASIDGADANIVYFQGGGHVIGSLDTHDFVGRNPCGGTE
jgi:acetyl esterase/lipase